MQYKILALPLLGAALVLGGCSSSGTAPNPDTPNFQNNVIAIGGDPLVQRTSGRLNTTPDVLTANVGGERYVIGNGTFVDQDGSISGYAYAEVDQNGNFNGDAVALAFVGEYARAGLLVDVRPGREMGYLMIDGTPTAAGDLPSEIANYGGFWVLGTSADADGGYGLFDAQVDFSRSRFDMALTDGEGFAAGSATGQVRGTGFSGTLDTTGTFVSSNTVYGQFYGPQAAEMAGLIQGSTPQGDPNVGFLIGHK